jgi:hypothetical protein
MYVDSALRKAAKLNENQEPEYVEPREVVNISWKDFKKTF